MSEKTVKTQPVKVQIVVTQKLAIGTMRPYYVVETESEVVYLLNDTSVTKLAINYIDNDQLTQMWSDIDERSKAVIFKVG